MTVIRLSNNRYEGLTADTKPTNVPAGAFYRDTQTDIEYKYNGSSWDIYRGNTKTETYSNKTVDAVTSTLKNVGPYKYEVYLDGSNWIARNCITGAITSSNTTFITVLQAAINALTGSRTIKESVRVRGSASVTGAITIPSYTILDLTDAKLTLANSTATHMFINSDTTGGNVQIEIVGGIIDGNKTNQAAVPADEDTRNIIQFTKVNDSSVRKMYIDEASSRAIRFNTCVNCTAEFNTVLDTGGEGIQSKDGSDIKIAYNTVKSTGYSNITTYGTEDAIIEGNYCDDTVSTTTSGINISSVRNKVIGNTVRNPGGACVFLAETGSTYDASGVQVVGNILSGSGDNGGIMAAGYPLTGAIISNNIIFGNFDEGIRFSGAHTNILIDNNLVYLNGGSGIYVSGTVSTSAVATHVKISDNICSNNGTAASANNYDRAGITARGTDTSGVVDIVIKNNTCYDDQGSPTQKYGVYIQNSLNSIVELNNLKNNQTDGILSTTNSGLRLFENNGYASDTPIATTTGTETHTNKTLTAPVINAATITGVITLDSTSATYVELVKPFTNSSAESILKIRLSEDTGSFIAVDNITGTNALFGPHLYGRNASSAALSGLTVSGQVHTSFDSGSKAALTLNAATHAGGALSTRPILDISSANTAEYTFSTTQADWKNNALVNATVNPTSNVIPFLNSYAYTIYIDGGAVKARNNLTGAITSNANLDPLITTILGGSNPSVEIQGGTYTLHSSFAGWTVPSSSKVHFEPGCIITVPNAYASYCFLFTANSQYSIIEGGYWNEAGSPASNWSWVKMAPDMTPSEEGVLHNTIRDATIYQASKPIHLSTDTTSWINSNHFENIFANRCKYLVYKEHANAFTALASGMNVNTFINCRMQAQSSTPQALGGVVGIDGDANNFINCSVWDLQAANASAKSLDVSSNARYTTIFGGYIASYNITDSGKWTAFHDKYQGLSSHKLGITAVEATGGGSNEIMATFKVRDDTNNFAQLENGTVTNALFMPQWRYKQYTANNFAHIDVHDVDTTFDTGTTPFYLIDFRKNNASAITSTTKPLLRIGNFATGLFDFYIDKFDMLTKNLVNAGINLTNNTVTDTSRAQGDLIKDNGTKYVRFPRGTAHQIPAVNAAGTDVVYTNPIPVAYDYIISKVSTTYYATKSGETVPKYSNTALHTLCASVVSDLGATGGVIAFAANTTFSTSGGEILLADNITWKGMDRITSVIKSTTNHQIFRWYPGLGVDDPLLNAGITDLHLIIHDTLSTKEAVYVDGSVNFKFNRNWVESKGSSGSSIPSTGVISTFFDTQSLTHFHYNLELKDNWYTGYQNGQDAFGSGNVINGIVTGNTFKDHTDGQAMGPASAVQTIFSNNSFYNTGNMIGLETDAHDNIISNNIGYNTTGIKLAGIDTTNVSRRNLVSGNIIIYGAGGIEAGNCIGDTIEGNKMIRTSTYGIRGAMHKCIIRNNEFIDTNHSNASTTVGGVSNTRGGIMLINNAHGSNPVPDMDSNIIQGNKLEDTGATFTDPVSSSSKSGNTGPIVLDTNCDSNILIDNQYIGLVSGTVVDYGTNTLIRDITPDTYETAKATAAMVSELNIPDGASYGSGIFSLSYATLQGTTGYDYGNATPSRHWTTGSSTGNKGGKTNFGDTRRNMLPRLFCKFAMNSTADHALFIGWATGFDYDAVHATTPLNAMMGIGVAAITGVSNFRIIHNDASGACTSLDTTKALDTSFHTIEIWTDNTNWYYNFDKGFKTGTISSDMPDASTNMYLHWTNLTNTTATKKFNVSKLLVKIKG